MRDHGGDHARHHHRGKRADRQGAEDLLQREKRSRERRVERGGDAGRGAGGDHDLGSRGIEPERAPQEGGERRAEHGDRPFTPGGAAGTERDGARRGARQRRPGGQPAAFARDRALDIGNGEPFVPPPGAAHDPVGPHHPEAGEERPVGQDPGFGEVDRGDEVVDAEGQIDQAVERDRAEPAAEADGHGEAEQDRVLVEIEPVEPVGEPVPHASGPARRLPGHVARGTGRIGKCG